MFPCHAFNTGCKVSWVFFFPCSKWPYQTCLINQPTNQPTNQSINQLINQSICMTVYLWQYIEGTNSQLFKKIFILLLFLHLFWKKIHIFSETTSPIDLKICSQQGIHVLKVHKKTFCRYLSRLFLEKKNGNAVKIAC